MIIEVFIFILAIFSLSFLGSKLVKSLTRVSTFLGVREFIIAFFLMAFATSLPNLFVGIGSAFSGVPEISLGDVLGGNLVDLTLIVALVVFFSRNNISADSKMVQSSAVFTGISVILPLILILDRNLNRIDGMILYAYFIIYMLWLFIKNKKFKKEYKDKENIFSFKNFLKDIFYVAILLFLLIISSQVIIHSAKLFAIKLNIPLALVSVLIVGTANCFPEAYFSIVASRKGKGWLSLGEMMGSLTICATLVLGTVAIISPFVITDQSPYLLARIFTIVAASLFLLFIRSGREITKKEGLIMLSVYIVFLLAEIFARPFFS